jgi:molybdopterin synthase sulfur carrier subunit
MKLKIHLFGMLADAAGKPEIIIEDARDSESLKSKAIQQYPGMNSTSFLVAINKKVVTGNQAVREEDEIAFLPPYSGG